MPGFMDRIKTAYHVMSGNRDPWFKPPDDKQRASVYPFASSFARPSYDSTRSVMAPIITRISIDVASIPFRHVKVDENGKFKEYVKSELDDRLTIKANIDQTGKAFIQDAAQTMLSSGHCVIVPVVVSSDPRSGSYDILSVRVGHVLEWFNGSVMVSLYDELEGQRKEIRLSKDYVAIAYNPMFAVMNEPNSTLRRLIDKLSLLDVADGKMFSPQLDLIIQLPYALKNDRRQAEAERRIETITNQLNDSKYGIAYVDSTERITQLNRPVTNDLVTTVTSLTESLRSQLGLTPSLFAGNPTPEELLHYNNRTIIPIVDSLTESMRASFFTRTAITQGHTVMGFPSLFKMAPLSEFADASDKFTRNEIMTTNEIRAEIGMPPSDDPEANKLRNKNLNKQGDPAAESPPPAPSELDLVQPTPVSAVPEGETYG